MSIIIINCFYFYFLYIVRAPSKAPCSCSLSLPSSHVFVGSPSSRCVPSSMPVAGKLFLSQRTLSNFLRALADIVVGKVGTDLVLRNSLQQVCGEKNLTIFTFALLREGVRLAQTCSLSLSLSALLCYSLLSRICLLCPPLLSIPRLGHPLLSSQSFLLPGPFLSSLQPVLLLPPDSQPRPKERLRMR